jgi:hypothetical protein
MMQSTVELVVVGHLLVERVSDVPGFPWCVHSSAPNSAWIEFYRSYAEAMSDAHAMLARGTH